MNATTYRILCGYAGPGVMAAWPWPMPVSIPFPMEVGTAVYVVVDAEGRTCYVGSVRRDSGGLASRLAEHLSNPAKRATWHTVWVVPLRPEVPTAEVRRIEGVIGAHLGPYASRQLPTPRPPTPAGSRRTVEVARP